MIYMSILWIYLIFLILFHSFFLFLISSFCLVFIFNRQLAEIVGNGLKKVKENNVNKNNIEIKEGMMGDSPSPAFSFPPSPFASPWGVEGKEKTKEEQQKELRDILKELKDPGW